MTNLDSTLQKIANNCLLFAVDAQTGEILPMTQDEFMRAGKQRWNWIPYTDPRIAMVHSTLVRAALRRWEMAS